MSKRPGRDRQTPGTRPRSSKASERARLPEGFRAEPLRQEAERGWEESDKSAANGTRRRAEKVRAQKLRRQSAREKDALIARLTERVARLEEELAKRVKIRGGNSVSG